LNFEGITRQSNLIKKIIKNFKSKNEAVEFFTKILTGNFTLIENEEMKIKMNSKFNSEEICRNFIFKFIEIFETENFSKMTFIFAEFIGLCFNELEKIYENGREGALFCLAENLINFFSEFVCEEGMDNLLEINPNVFEEMMENGIDLYKENSKKENVKCQKEYVSFLYFIFYFILGHKKY